MLNEWKENYNGCQIEFRFDIQQSGYWFKIFLDEDKIFDSGEHGISDSEKEAKDWAFLIIDRHLENL